MKNKSKTQILSFVKEKNKWYADLPQFLEDGIGTKDDLLMVAGADTFLDILSNNSDNVTLEMSTESFEGYQTVMQKMKGEGLKQLELDMLEFAGDEGGAFYMVKELNGNEFHHQLWLCPVTEYVFDCYPEQIYAKVS